MEKNKKRHGKSIAREHAIQGLYTYQMMDKLMMVESDDKMAFNMVVNVIKNLDTIDTSISKYLKKWTLLELNPVVLAILRLAVYELKFDETDERIVVNEAIEFAKTYADDKAKKFIHSVLDSIIKE